MRPDIGLGKQREFVTLQPFSIVPICKWTGQHMQNDIFSNKAMETRSLDTTLPVSAHVSL
jgi:hypothetical protein